MTAVAIRRGAGKAIRMTTCTFNRCMLAFQWEVRFAVIKIRFPPTLSGMAHRAVGRETLRDVIGRSVVLGLVATEAIGTGSR